MRLDASAIVVEVLTHKLMHGLLLSLGVISAALSVTLLFGGMLFLGYGLFAPHHLIQTFDVSEGPDRGLLGLGFFYLFIGILMAAWPPAESWIIVGVGYLTGLFLLVVDFNLREDEERLPEIGS